MANLPPSPATTAPAIWRSLATDFRCRTGLLILILIPIEIVMAARLHLSGLAQWLSIWPSVGMLLCSVWYCRWRPLPKLILATEFAVWSILLMAVLSLLVQIAARSPSPLADIQLAQVDALMHFQTVSIMQMVHRIPWLVIALNISYSLTEPLVLCAILIPPMVGREVASRRFITGVLLAAILTVIVFAFVPAAGPWTMQPIQPTRDQAEITTYLDLLKSPATIRLNRDLGAIVSFPSFHTVLAILSAAALGSIARIRVPVWILATLICISTVTTGWHYGVDVIAGVALSVITLWLVRRIEQDTSNLL